jgi:hypothetical protein
MLHFQWFLWSWPYLCRLRIIDEEAQIGWHRSRISPELITRIPRPKTPVACAANCGSLHHSLCLSLVQNQLFSPPEI